MENKRIGKYTICFGEPPFVQNYASVAGKKESEGPLRDFFDSIIEDPMLGTNSWEEAEGQLQYHAVQKALDKARLRSEDMDYLFAGDLLGQTMATSFGIKNFGIPHFGLYGACSTMGESLSLASMIIAGGYGKRAVAVTSSHFASAEKQFRFPLMYGNQRSLAATWTVTGSGAVIVEDGRNLMKNEKDKHVRITGVTTGKIVDYGIKDSQNMGACMAPAASFVIANHLRDMQRKPEDYDQIITGDLGSVGQKLLFDLMLDEGYDISKVHMDCGMTIFDSETQDTHAGGSGCGCAAVTLCGYIMNQLETKTMEFMDLLNEPAE